MELVEVKRRVQTAEVILHIHMGHEQRTMDMGFG